MSAAPQRAMSSSRTAATSEPHGRRRNEPRRYHRCLHASGAECRDMFSWRQPPSVHARSQSQPALRTRTLLDPLDRCGASKWDRCATRSAGTASGRISTSSLAACGALGRILGRTEVRRLRPRIGICCNRNPLVDRGRSRRGCSGGVPVDWRVVRWRSWIACRRSGRTTSLVSLGRALVSEWQGVIPTSGADLRAWSRDD